MAKFVEPFLVSFLITVFFLSLLVLFGRKISWKRRRAFRHIHNKNVFRIGGVAMILGFNLTLLFNSHLVISPELWSVMFASVLILIFGFWDDVREVFWKAQLFFSNRHSGIGLYSWGENILYYQSFWGHDRSG